ncbi:MAG: 2-oxoglutarate dehydrogenase complex dihydrolipoyllysine-residue succinyltransferase [Planctomycetes bacterium]|nr:2-oxoglutarate dehydrogenase complex dihydrolipoyllysine-residue succinyltransferase [Planctomycetota bacterium]
MSVEIKVPSVGESVSEGVLSRWVRKAGQGVKAGEPVFELETDKASQEIASPAEGTLEVIVQEGQKVMVGQVVGKILPGKVTSSAAPANAPAAPANTPAPAPVAKASSVQAASPSARQMADEHGLDTSKISGTGRDGRVIKEDVQAAIGSTKSAPASSEPAKVSPTRSETRTRMSTLRQRIAERLLSAQQNAAILTTFNEADMSAVMALRAKYKDSFQKKHGVGLGFMGFFVKAVAEAARVFPAVNARIEGSDVVTPNYLDVGVAVSTEKGLMVPVLRDADKMTFAQIEKGIVELAVKARDGKISVADLQGGTFTITNGGVFGSLLSTPILNPPQSGILGMHTIQKRPVVVDDQIAIRPMMYLALSYDHRLIDGREAVGFLVRVKECIENPERLMLEV